MSPSATAFAPPLPAADSAPARDALIWNAALGLWGRPSPGHTRPVAQLPQVHSGVESAVKLHALLQLGQLDDERLAAAVEGLLDLQVAAGRFEGCFRWYAEETEPQDTNASFFIGLALQLLMLGHPRRIPSALRSRLDAACDRLNRWFLAELAHHSPVYPNKYLGDLVCAWLGHELLGQPAPDSLVLAFADALDYWEKGNWGWGEHQSDVYAGVLLTEFSALLLFERRLPPDLRAHCLRLTRDLLAIDDYYGSGPRVPQIRCYDFNQSPVRLAFRAQVEQPWPARAPQAWSDARAQRRYMLLPFGPLFRASGWSALFPQPAAGASTAAHAGRRIALAAGACAHAWVDHSLRTGTLSRWPMLPGAEHQAWGLSWQTFPAAFWRPSGDWGFLRFTTRQGDDVRSHPALEKSRAYLANALGPGEPPPVGLTACAQNGSAWIALRALPGRAAWDEVSDGFWLHQLTAAPVVMSGGPAFSSLRLVHSDGELWLHHIPVCPGPAPVLARHASGRWSWTVSARSPEPAFWALSESPPPAAPPAVQALAPGAFSIQWPDTPWRSVVLSLPDEAGAPG